MFFTFFTLQTRQAFGLLFTYLLPGNTRLLLRGLHCTGRFKLNLDFLLIPASTSTVEHSLHYASQDVRLTLSNQFRAYHRPLYTTMSTPTVPQRPSRSSHPPVSLEEPKVPPRPTRKFERSLSRDRENYARSPLNESPFQTPDSPNAAQRPANLGALRRPPSVASLPLIGQEGSEYASLEEAQAITDTSNSDGLTVPTATSNVSSDLPLHAPKASAGPATTSRLAEVTRTGSAAADSSGYGSVPSSRPLSVSQDRPASSISRERPGSAADHRPWETDIPEIGVRVPMYPNAGDVQAPTPGPGSATPSSGVGFFNNASSRPVTAGSTSGRRKSAQFQVPAGSYGLHGHGVGPQDQFEKSWYQRHPEELNKEEHGYHGPAAAVERHDWNMSSEQLNKLVRESGRRQNVMGDNPPLSCTTLQYTNMTRRRH